MASVLTSVTPFWALMDSHPRGLPSPENLGFLPLMVQKLAEVKPPIGLTYRLEE